MLKKNTFAVKTIGGWDRLLLRFFFGKIGIFLYKNPIDVMQMRSKINFSVMIYQEMAQTNM